MFRLRSLARRLFSERVPRASARLAKL